MNMDHIVNFDRRPNLADPDSLSKLSKDRRDWLEIFGNTWGCRQFVQDPMTDDEKRALLAALNPWSTR